MPHNVRDGEWGVGSGEGVGGVAGGGGTVRVERG